MRKITAGVVVALVSVAGIVYFFDEVRSSFEVQKEPAFDTRESTSDTVEMMQKNKYSGHGDGLSDIPSGISLPFKMEDIGTSQGEVNPFGVIRFAEDNGHGHGGIDFPLHKDSLILAVADGEVVRIKSAGDDWGGEGIYQSFGDDAGSGVTWSFLYEHVRPQVRVGDRVKRGQVIATKIAPNQFTAHFQMTYLFNNYEYSKNDVCWPEKLVEGDREKLDQFWSSYRSSSIMVSSWSNILRDGGVDLCYPMNTDARGGGH